MVSNKNRLSPVGSFNVTLTLGEAIVNTNISVFRGVDDALLSWSDSRALHIIPRSISTLTSAVWPRAKSGKGKAQCSPGGVLSLVFPWSCLGTADQLADFSTEVAVAEDTERVAQPSKVVCLDPRSSSFLRGSEEHPLIAPSFSSFRPRLVGGE